jgi:hypothetical protein
MRQALEDLELQNGYALSVSVKRLPARKVVSFRDVIRDFNEEGLLWERLDMLCRANGVRLGDAQYFSGEIQPDSRCQSAPISMDRAKWLQDIGKSAQCLLPVAGKRTKPG